MKIQEYLVDSEYVTIWGEVVDRPDMVIVSENSDYGNIRVVKRSELVKREDTWEFKQAQKRADELRLITAKAEENYEAICEKLIKSACSTLKTRMKMNVLFGKNSDSDGWAVVIANELDALVRKEAKDIIEKETK